MSQVLNKQTSPYIVHTAVYYPPSKLVKSLTCPQNQFNYQGALHLVHGLAELN